MTKITKKAMKEILSSNKAKAHLMIAFDRSEQGVEAMVKRNDIRLTTPLAIQAMKEGTGLTEEQIFETANA